jgi:hypothetical protein
MVQLERKSGWSKDGRTRGELGCVHSRRRILIGYGHHATCINEGKLKPNTRRVHLCEAKLGCLAALFQISMMLAGSGVGEACVVIEVIVAKNPDHPPLVKAEKSIRDMSSGSHPRRELRCEDGDELPSRSPVVRYRIRSCWRARARSSSFPERRFWGRECK